MDNHDFIYETVIDNRSKMPPTGPIETTEQFLARNGRIGGKMVLRTNDKTFKAQFQADDGYAGGSRPLWFYIDAAALDDDMTESDLRNLFWEALDEAFEQQVHPVSQDGDKFVAWAKERIKEACDAEDSED